LGYPANRQTTVKTVGLPSPKVADIIISNSYIHTLTAATVGVWISVINCGSCDRIRVVFTVQQTSQPIRKWSPTCKVRAIMTR